MDLRRIDALVAEHVMGLDLDPVEGYEQQVTTGPRKAWDGGPDLREDGWEEWRKWERFDYHEERYWRRPVRLPVHPKPYTTDIAAAWEVIETLRATKDARLDLDSAGLTWTARISWWANDPDADYVLSGYASASTAPLAICAAALKALDISVTDT